MMMSPGNKPTCKKIHTGHVYQTERSDASQIAMQDVLSPSGNVAIVVSIYRFGVTSPVTLHRN
jgi:hypothetical protein